MKIGTIDIGTNSMRLLIAEYRDGKLVNRKKYVNTTRIGQGVDKQGYITDDAIERNIKVLSKEGAWYTCFRNIIYQVAYESKCYFMAF